MSTFIHWAGWADLRDWLGVTATASAAWFAALTIRQAKRQQVEALENLVEERRIDHELTVLRAISEAVAAERSGLYVGGLVGMTSLRLPITRAVHGLGSGDDKILYDHARQEQFAKRGYFLGAAPSPQIQTLVRIGLVMDELAEQAHLLALSRPNGGAVAGAGSWSVRRSRAARGVLRRKVSNTPPIPIGADHHGAQGNGGEHR